MFILRSFPLSNSTEEETGRHIYKKKKPKNKNKIKPKETKKKLLLEFAKSLPVAVLLLFCLVKNCIQVFNVPASLRCLIPCSLGVVLEPWFSLMRRTVLLCQRRRLTCKIYTGRPFTSESLHKGGPKFFREHSLQNWLYLFFLYELPRKHDPCFHSFSSHRVDGCCIPLSPLTNTVFSPALSWISECPSPYWTRLSISPNVIIAALFFAVAHCFVGGQPRFRSWKGQVNSKLSGAMCLLNMHRVEWCLFRAWRPLVSAHDTIFV